MSCKAVLPGKERALLQLGFIQPACPAGPHAAPNTPPTLLRSLQQMSGPGKQLQCRCSAAGVIQQHNPLQSTWNNLYWIITFTEKVNVATWENEDPEHHRSESVTKTYWQLRYNTLNAYRSSNMLLKKKINELFRICLWYTNCLLHLDTMLLIVIAQMQTATRPRLHLMNSSMNPSMQSLFQCFFFFIKQTLIRFACLGGLWNRNL